MTGMVGVLRSLGAGIKHSPSALRSHRLDETLAFGRVSGAVDLPAYAWQRKTFNVAETIETAGLTAAAFLASVDWGAANRRPARMERAGRSEARA